MIPWLRVHGDFEIRVSFELRELAPPDAGYGVGPTVDLWADSKEGDAVSLGRTRRVDEGEIDLMRRIPDAMALPDEL